MTEEVIRGNFPELSKEEKLLLGMDTMEIEKDIANKYLIDHVTNKNK